MIVIFDDCNVEILLMSSPFDQSSKCITRKYIYLFKSLSKFYKMNTAGSGQLEPPRLVFKAEKLKSPSL